MRLFSVLAKFPRNDRTYAYLVPEGDVPSVGDLILTSTVEDSDFYRPDDQGRPMPNKEANFATIIDVHDYPMVLATKFYLLLMPQAVLAARRQQNVDRREHEKRRKNAQVELDRILAQEDRTERYRRLAENDPRAKELLEIIQS